jgi:hypothetical protein
MLSVSRRKRRNANETITKRNASETTRDGDKTTRSASCGNASAVGVTRRRSGIC